MTQEVLAERSGLSADTIRRLEHGNFSPSLDTLRKLCDGLDLMLSTLFASFEIGEADHGSEIADLLSKMTPRKLRLGLRLLRSLAEDDEDEAVPTEAEVAPIEDVAEAAPAEDVAEVAPTEAEVEVTPTEAEAVAAPAEDVVAPTEDVVAPTEDEAELTVEDE